MARYAEALTEPKEIALWEKIPEMEGKTFIISVKLTDNPDITPGEE